MKNRNLGNIGEEIAANYLEKKGLQIIEKNFYCRQGEIDIIAKENDEIVFIEVKTRTSKNFGTPVEAVTSSKKLHIYKTAKFFLYKNHINNIGIRFDVVEIMLENGQFKLNHIKQVM